MKTLLFLIKLLLCTLLISCSTDDEIIEQIPEGSIIVKATSIVVGNASREFGENDTFEVYGNLGVQLVLEDIVLDHRVLWQRELDSFETIAEDEAYTINNDESEQVFILTEEQLKKDLKLNIYAELFDYDFDSDDDELIKFGNSFEISAIDSETIKFSRDSKPSRIQLDVLFTLERSSGN